jgi:two-component system, OmpR family, sensor histidine kinase MprB
VTFRRRLALLSAAAVAIAVLMASVIVFFVVCDQLRDQVDSALTDLAGGARVTELPVPARGHEKGRGPLALALPRQPLGTPGGYGQLISEDGLVLQASRKSPALPVTEATLAVAAGERNAFFQDVNLDGAHLRVLTERAGPGQAIQVARSLDEVDDTLARLGLILAAVVVVGAGLAGVLGLAISRTAIAPVARLTSAAEHVARTRDLGRRIYGGDRRDELDRLAASFNAMLAELERAVAGQRQLVADASHELRTPLTSLRTNIEVLANPSRLSDDDRGRLLEDVVAQLDELGGLVGSLIDLAREAEPEAEHEVRLDRLVAAAVERTRRRGVRVETTLEPCLVRVVPERIDRAIGNLLDNAAKWSPTDQEVEVTVTAAGEVSVRDHGPGIAASDLPKVFDRFYRAAGARGMPGSGLGLAIVRRTAEAHGGSVSATQAPGGGTLLRFALPAARLSVNSSAVLS